MKNHFIRNDSILLHALENGGPSDSTPTLLILCGIWEPAERALPLMSGLSGHSIALSLRGRGLSSAPSSGYDLEDHLSDIAAVVAHFGLKNYCLLGFSRGASYALGWTLQHQQEMKGLLLVDQPPVHINVSAEGLAFWTNLVYRGVPVLQVMRREALEGLHREAVTVDFAARLEELGLPVTLFVGKDEQSAVPSNLTEADLDVYARAIPSLKLVEFPHSGHMIPDDEPERYAEEVERFVSQHSLYSKGSSVGK
ncbi:alpha/beta fold hydrolase [Gorillibacterium timonense]|uniref:alpha/beta fold hydrolase n=1 Tax=Gorillibacterium timonense TaxID=1689269 RepID=UPI00071D8B09|nr:alpha/beta hydrolase [Gorillibacterium timonense]